MGKKPNIQYPTRNIQLMKEKQNTKKLNIFLHEGTETRREEQ